MKHVYLLALPIIISFACSKYSQSVEDALTYAGENRCELEKVLEHYSQNPSDSLKKKAAIFLIENMPGHFSYEEGSFAKFTEDVIPICKMDTDVLLKKQLIDSLILKHNIDNIKPEPDIQIISANYLIHSIDFSFKLWNKPWAKHLTFDQFCEYLLPYKYTELQQLDYWKDSLYNRMSPLLEQKLLGGIDGQYTFYVANIINDKVKSSLHSYYLPFPQSYLFFNTSLLEHLQYGACTDYSTIELAIFRANGIPAASELFPNRGRNRDGHGWMSILNTNGTWISLFDGFKPNFFGLFYPNQDHPKVFQITYKNNRRLPQSYNNSKYTKYFSPFTTDITDRYIRCSHLSIPIQKSKITDKYAFIASFDNQKWKPADIGEIKNRKAVFTNIGRNIAYIILGFDENKLIPISKPFLLKSNGDIEYIETHSSLFEQVTLHRKFPTTNMVLQMENRLMGGRIEASNNPDFRDSIVLHTINDINKSYQININRTTPYRYWRYSSPNESFCNIAELQFFQNTKSGKIRKQGKIIGTLDVLNENPQYAPEKAFDEDPLTIFHSKDPNNTWIGLDFEEPTSIDQICIMPRSDGNRIQAGDTYELVYWNGNEWESLGTQAATRNYLRFDSVPKGVLLLLHNHTKGQQERIFRYVNGEIEWW